jgi:UDP-3-O-[3-hydroxymyristoyl] glucosamine N-acyltransferase
MKKIILFFTALVFSNATVFPQGCLPEGITFTTQTQIDSFQINYPGCTQIEGNVYVEGNNIVNLNGLNVLTSIGENLHIGQTYVSNMIGLDNLTFIGGNFIIGPYWYDGNPELTILSGLEGLTSIGGALDIRNNNSLTSLTGINNLTSIQGGLSISENYSLTSLSALNSLTNTGGEIKISGNSILPSLAGLDNIDASSINHLELTYNDSLTTCSIESVCSYLANPNGTIIIASNSSGCDNPPEVADDCGITFSCLPHGDYCFYSQSDIDNFQTLYPGCTQLQGNVIIAGSDITNLYGLSVVTSIEESLAINGYALTNLNGLNNLASIGGSLSIGGCFLLPNLIGLDNLTSIGNVISIRQSYLTNLVGLGNVTSIGGLHIEMNYFITNLVGLDNLSSIPGDVHIEENYSLTSLAGLENVTSIGDGLYIEMNDALLNLTGLANLTSIGGTLRVYNDNTLNNLSGLENLTYIGGDVWIEFNDSILSLQGVDNLNEIDGSLYLGGNYRLNSLTGIEHLTSIGGRLSIGQNIFLTSLAGLENIDSESISEIYIAANYSLSSCEVQSICDYLASPNSVVEINNNAPGCNSPKEVEAACHVGLENYFEKGIFNIYPNPFTAQFSFEFYLQHPCMVNLVVHNSLGKVVATLADGVLASGTHQVFWNAGNLPAGIYYCRLQAGDRMVSNKVIKTK